MVMRCVVIVPIALMTDTKSLAITELTSRTFSQSHVIAIKFKKIKNSVWLQKLCDDGNRQNSLKLLYTRNSMNSLESFKPSCVASTSLSYII